MKECFCIIPCNGLDKSLGVITRNVALKLLEKDPDMELVCPVLLNSGDKKYDEILKMNKIIVIDGCITRCATKLIEQRDLKPLIRIFIPDMSKIFKIKPSKELILIEQGQELAELISNYILENLKSSKEELRLVSRKFGDIECFDVTVDKYYFRVPKEGYYFNENDCWIKPEEKNALMGITDYLQNAAGDILFVDLPELNSEIEQFEDVGSFESSKTILQLISPGSGKVIAINKELEKNPEFINQDSYGKGWFVEIELKDFEEDLELLMDGPNYFEYMKEKIMKEKNHFDQIKSEINVE